MGHAAWQSRYFNKLCGTADCLTGQGTATAEFVPFFQLENCSVSMW
jgi:hypothetical protein